MSAMSAWLRYRLFRAIALPRPVRYSQAEGRYPRTVRGGIRYLREQVAPSEVDWYEGWRR